MPGSTCDLANGFSTWEKVYAQVSFVAMGGIGIVGIALIDRRWAVAYIVFYLYGIMGVVMRHLVCPRCPHLHVYNDCLQAPRALTRWLVRERKTTPMSRVEKALFYTYFIVVPMFPLYWLRERSALLIAFLVFAGAWYGGQYFRFCRRCRVEHCPFNRAHALLSAGR